MNNEEILFHENRKTISLNVYSSFGCVNVYSEEAMEIIKTFHECGFPISIKEAHKAACNSNNLVQLLSAVADGANAALREARRARDGFIGVYEMYLRQMTEEEIELGMKMMLSNVE